MGAAKARGSEDRDHETEGHDVGVHDVGGRDLGDGAERTRGLGGREVCKRVEG